MTRPTAGTRGPVRANLGSALGAADQRKWQDASQLPQPRIPAPVSWPPSDDGLLVFDGASLVVELTDVIRTKGGSPKLVIQEYVGRQARTALDPPELAQATVEFIVTSGAQAVHDAIVGRCAAGEVLRVYGPSVGPVRSGAVWAFEQMPEPEVVGPMNSDGSLRAMRMTLALRAWSPIGSLRPQAGSRVGSDGPRRRAAQGGSDRLGARTTGPVRVGGLPF